MGIFNSKEHQALKQIQQVCQHLDEEILRSPEYSRNSVSLMYYFASLRIKRVFGIDTPVLVGQKELFALSGLKKPLNQLIDLTRQSEPNSETDFRDVLINLSYHFDQRFQEIALKKINPKFNLDIDAQVSYQPVKHDY